MKEDKSVLHYVADLTLYSVRGRGINASNIPYILLSKGDGDNRREALNERGRRFLPFCCKSEGVHVAWSMAQESVAHTR